MNPRNVDLVLCGVTIRASPNLDILGIKFDSKLTFEDHVLVLCPVSLSELVFWGWWSASLWTPLCYFVAMMYLFSQSQSIFLGCEGQLLYVTFSFLSARCVRLQGFALIRVSCHCVIDFMLLECECCARLIQTGIIVYSLSFHMLLPELDLPELSSQTIHWSWSIKMCKVFSAGRSSYVEWPSLHSVWHRNIGWVYWISQPFVASISCVVWVFLGAGACGVAKVIYKQLCFSHLDLCRWF